MVENGESCQMSKELDALMAAFKADLISLYDMQLATYHAKLRASVELTLRDQQCVASASYSDQACTKDQLILPNEHVGSCKHQVNSISQDEEAVEQPSPSLITEAQHLAAPALKHNYSNRSLDSKESTVSKYSKTFKRIMTTKFESAKHRKCVFRPQNVFVIFWSLVISCFTVVCLWADSLAAVDSSFPGGHGPFGYWWEVVAMCAFGFDIIMNFNIAVEDQSLRTYSYERCHIATSYVKSWFFLDLLTAIPFTVILSAAVDNVGRLARLARVMKVCRVFRIAKFVKVVWKNEFLSYIVDVWDHWLCSVLASEDGIGSFYKLVRFVGIVLQHLSLIYIQSHLMACFLLLSRNTPDLHWVHDGVAASDLPVWRRFTVAIWWAFTIIATGFDDPVLDFLHPNGEVCMLKITAACLHAVLIIFFFQALAKLNVSDDMDFRFRYNMMNSYLRNRRGITNSTRRRVLHSLESHRQARVRENIYLMIAEELDPNLRYDVMTDIFGTLFESFVLFSQFPFPESFGYRRLIADLCSMSTTHFFIEGEKIIAAGRNPGGMIFIISGQAHYDYSQQKQPHGQLYEAPDRNPSFLPSRGHRFSLSPGDGSTDKKTVVRINMRNEIGKKHFHAVECLFVPKGLNIHPKYDFIADSRCESGMLSRKRFDELLISEQSPPVWRSFVDFIRSQVEDDTIAADTLHAGVDEDVIQKWESTALGRNTSYDLEDCGVALAYLQHQFKHDLHSEVGALDFTNASFNDLGKHIWMGGVHRGFRGSAEKLSPRDGLKGTSIVDALQNHEKGIATYFVSWCWCYTVDMMLSALGTWAMGNNINSSQCFFWMCFFCNNQRKLLVDKDQINLANSFSSRLLRIGKMIMVFNNYIQSEYTHRIWCIYEVFTASKHQIALSLAMPENCQADFQKELAHGNLIEMIESLRNISVESAEATQPKDKAQILQLIENTTGFEAVNETVKCALMGWLTGAFQECLQQSMTSEPARIVAGLILKDTGHAREFDCHAWEVAVGRHPGLMDLFEFDADLPPKDAFEVLSASGCGRVNIQALDFVLHQKRGNNMLTFARWLHDWAPRDSVLAAIAADVHTRLREECQTMQRHLKEHEQLFLCLNSLHCLSSERLQL